MRVKQSFCLNFKVLPIILLFCFFLDSEIPSYAKSDTISIVKGRTIDTVRCSKYPGFSYALYLPGNYSETRKWPVIYIFHPGAKGSKGVECFRQVTERYGYILVCSNDSRNGPLDKSIEAANNVFEDVESRFSVNFNRIYTSGFSGGSRVAALVALSTKRIAGVIGCGAGLPFVPGLQPTKSDSYVYFGLVGNKDFNYYEMFELYQKFDKLGITANLSTYDAGHSLPPSSELQNAVDWLELQAMNKGLLERNDSFINIQFEKNREQIKMLENQKNFFDAGRYYKYLIRDFSYKPEIINDKIKFDSLQRLKEYKKAVKEWNRINDNEKNIAKDLVISMNSIVEAESFPDSVRWWWIRKIGKLKKMETGNDKNEQRMATRLLHLLIAICREQGNTFINNSNYNKSVLAYRLLVIVWPEDKQSHYSLARAYAFKNDSEESLNALEKAVELGLERKQVLEDSAFNCLKDEKRYKAILAKLQ